MQPSAPPVSAVMKQQAAMRADPLNAFTSVLGRYEITLFDAEEMLQLCGHRIVFVADDSGSMKQLAPCRESHGWGARRSRWELLQSVVSEVVDIATALPGHGTVDVHFLNRPAVLGVTGGADDRLCAAMVPYPEGKTPLTATVDRIVTCHNEQDERPLLLFIATDGEPSPPPNCPRESGVAMFSDLVQRIVRRGGVRMMFLACTEDEGAIGWLHDLDRRFPGEVCVTEDYECERQEVLRLGKVKQFTRGDWIVKALLGAVSPTVHEHYHQPRRFALCSNLTACGSPCVLQ